MPRCFKAKPLTPDQVAQAFPLVQSAIPGLTLEDWRRYARQLEARRGAATPYEAGIVTIQSEQGYIHGLFSYVVEPDLRHSRVLSIENFVALDLVEREAAAAAVFKAMEEVAANLDCRAIHVHLPDMRERTSGDGDWLVQLLRREGHETETIRLCKPFDHAALRRART